VTALTAHRRLPAGGAKPDWLVVLLHGLGGSGANMLSFAEYWAKALPGVTFVAPDGPDPCPQHPEGFQWISKRAATDPLLYEEVCAAAPLINAFADAELQEAALPPERLALVGFSQGTLMALHVGLRRATPPAAVLGFSGGLAGADKLEDEITARPPTMLIHGEQDALAPVYAMMSAVKTLEKNGVVAHGHVIPGLGHEVNVDALVIGARFLHSAFAYQERHS